MVLIIMAVLTAIGMPFLIRSLHQGRVNEAVNLIAFTVEEARQAAQQQRGLYEQIEVPVVNPVPYGVIVRQSNATATPGERAHVVLMGYQTGENTPQQIAPKQYFNANVDVVFPASRGDEQEIWFEFETGFLGDSWGGGGVAALGADEAIRLHVATNDYAGAWQSKTIGANVIADYEYVFTKGLHGALTLFPFVGISHVE
jgi:type II secretory pathway pseudopilin PulG